MKLIKNIVTGVLYVLKLVILFSLVVVFSRQVIIGDVLEFDEINLEIGRFQISVKDKKDSKTEVIAASLDVGEFIKFPDPTPTPFLPEVIPEDNNELVSDIIIEEDNTSVYTETQEQDQEPVLINDPIEEPENPFDFEGIRFDIPEKITMKIISSNFDEITVSFIPVVYMGDDNICKAGLEKDGLGLACVYADSIGNIYVGIHSGCLYTGNINNPYKSLEGEGLRSPLEGGTCNDITAKYTPEKIIENMVNLTGSNVFFIQGDITVEMKLEKLGIVPNDRFISNEPNNIVNLLDYQFSTEERLIIPVTCGWGVSQGNSWYIANRWILITSN